MIFKAFWKAKLVFLIKIHPDIKELHTTFFPSNLKFDNQLL
jgi:hypothetical protein